MAGWPVKSGKAATAIGAKVWPRALILSAKLCEGTLQRGGGRGKDSRREHRGRREERTRRGAFLTGLQDLQDFSAQFKVSGYEWTGRRVNG